MISSETKRKISNERMTPPERVQASQAVRRSLHDVIRKAYCKVDAGSKSTIVCYLDTDGTGEEITVYCEISDGSNLNTAIRRLADGDMLKVYYDATDSKWRALEGFQAVAEDCDEEE